MQSLMLSTDENLPEVVLSQWLRESGVTIHNPAADTDPDAGLYALSHDEFEIHLCDTARELADIRVLQLTENFGSDADFAGLEHLLGEPVPWAI